MLISMDLNQDKFIKKNFYLGVGGLEAIGKKQVIFAAKFLNLGNERNITQILFTKRLGCKHNYIKFLQNKYKNELGYKRLLFPLRIFHLLANKN